MLGLSVTASISTSKLKSPEEPVPAAPVVFWIGPDINIPSAPDGENPVPGGKLLGLTTFQLHIIGGVVFMANTFALIKAS
jgi:hypothetical protein